MIQDAPFFGTIYFEELPHHIQHHSIQALRPSSIEEDEDDPRSLLYLFEDNDFERAAAFFAIEQARHQSQEAAEALAEAEAQEHRTRVLANRLRQMLEEDDELVDMLGRRILARNGYQMPDLWQPHFYHYLNSPQYFHCRPYDAYTSPQASTSRASQKGHDRVSGLVIPTRVFGANDAMGELEEEGARSGYLTASTFIHAAPVRLQGHAPCRPKVTQQFPATPCSSVVPSQSPSRYVRPLARTNIAVHPLTGVPMLLVEDELDADEASSSCDAPVVDQGLESDDDVGEWDIHDESDLDWLGRELLRRQGGANVWVLGTEDDTAPRPASHSNKEEAPYQSLSPSAGPSATAQVATRTSSAAHTLPIEIQEVDSDHELADEVSILNSSRGRVASGLSGPSQRVAAALAQAALLNPKSAQQVPKTSGASGPTRRQRAATVMSESEEEELETVGRPVFASDADEKDTKDDASSLHDRPRKTIRVVDLR